MTSPIRLTEFARGGGCAAKLRLNELSAVLETMPAPAPMEGGGAEILVDRDFSDDAAVVQIAAGRATVLTADVIAPLVDDPETFGEIAATNAMSDVWAMGGEPRFALNLVFFPDDKLPLDVLHAILRGGARACARAGVAVVGGHSVRDPEVKYGLSVTGDVAPDRILSNRTAVAGQALVLTKALGTGVISSAIKQGLAAPDEIAAAVKSMTTLNGEALAVGRRHGVTACTDVTGFGLLGHLRNILRGSSLDATIELDALPLLPGAFAHASAGRLPGGSKCSREFLAPITHLRGGAPLRPEPGSEPRDVLASLACDAQTSGGLLLALPNARAAAAVAELRGRGLPAAQVGELRAPKANQRPGTIELV